MTLGGIYLKPVTPAVSRRPISCSACASSLTVISSGHHRCSASIDQLSSVHTCLGLTSLPHLRVVFSTLCTHYTGEGAEGGG